MGQDFDADLVYGVVIPEDFDDSGFVTPDYDSDWGSVLWTWFEERVDAPVELFTCGAPGYDGARIEILVLAVAPRCSVSSSGGCVTELLSTEVASMYNLEKWRDLRIRKAIQWCRSHKLPDFSEASWLLTSSLT